MRRRDFVSEFSGCETICSIGLIKFRKGYLDIDSIVR